MKPKPPITDPLANFLESGLAITVATRDGDLQPDGAWAWAARVHKDRIRVTLYFFEKAAVDVVRNLESHPAIAAVLDQPTSHRACQLKGTFLASRPAQDSDRALVERQLEGLRTELAAIGIPRAMTVGWEYWPCVAVSMRVEQLFEQTPGPGAGEPMR